MAQTAHLSEARRALLERYLRGDMPASGQGSGASIEHVAADSAPLSFGQEQLWLLSRLLPNSIAYNECLTIHMPGPFDLAAFQRAFQAFLERHAAWRTTFPIVDGQPIQRIHPPTTAEVPVVDLRALPAHEREPEALRRAQAEAQRPFDLASGPLFRPLLMRIDDTTHRLYLALHHIIFDGVAVYQVLLPELRALYDAQVAGTPAPLPPPPIAYSDYARWQREQLSDALLAQQLDYWRRQLAGAPLALDLPTDHPRPAVQSYRGAMLPFALAPHTSDALRALSRREGVTLYMILVAAFATLLYRQSGLDDLLMGTATAGRNREELRHLVGYFLNTLALRIDLRGNPTFSELLQRVRAVTVAAYDHEDVPFATLVQALQPARTPGQNPIFQVMLSLEPPLPTVAGGWTLTQMDVHISKAKFDLSIELDDRPEGLIGRFEYSTDLFDAATIGRLAAHWQNLLASILADPSQRIAQLELLAPDERRQIVEEWNATDAEYPSERCVHQLFEDQVARAPEAVALLCGQRELTYAELNARANRFAQHLRQLGATAGDCVGVCLERSPEMIVAVLAILKLGAAYVPLDPTYPAERLAFMLHDTQARLVVTAEHLTQRLPTAPDDGPSVVVLDSADQAYADQPAENLTSAVTSASRAYVMYTSGSTGLPKGVAIRHRGIVRLVCGVGYAQLDASRTMLHMAPLTFDASNLEIFGALLHGARCVILPQWIPTPSEIGAAIRAHGVTTVWLTASLFNAIIDEAPHVLVGVRQVLTGGEALSVPHVCRALDLLPGTQLINGYGPTETTTFACCFPIPRQFSANARSVPIGRPIANTRVYVLDRQAQVVPVGVVGELYIGGAGVADGYLRRPELTAERFVPDAFSADPAARLYRTGDAVRWLPDGNIEFVGRLDQQVKVRGFRVEPAEVEMALKRQAGVRDALVLARADRHASKRLVAYVVPDGEQPLAASTLRALLSRSLPAYMVPSAFVIRRSLPTFASGKLDRRALLDMDLSLGGGANTGQEAPDDTLGETTEDGVAEPTTALHRLLKDIWEDLLDVRPIGISDNFFDLGGHSLLAARLVARLEQAYGVSVPLARFYANPTIEHLARAWESQSEAAPRSLLVPVQPSGTKPPLFFLHGDFNGGGYYCWNLARHLGTEQPLYALEPYGLDGGAIPPTVEAMASGYVRLLQSQRAHGPYRLGGYCNGALVAFEVARQLAAAGESVERLALVDVSSVNAGRRVGYGALAAVGRLAGRSEDRQLRWFLALRHLYRRARYAPATVSILARLGRFSAKFDAARTRLGLPGPARPHESPPATESRLSDVWGRYGWATTRYRPRAYAGSVLLLLPAQGGAESPEGARRHWQRVASHVAVAVIPGDHESCVTKYGESLAAALARHLEGDELVAARA